MKPEQMCRLLRSGPSKHLLSGLILLVHTCCFVKGDDLLCLSCQEVLEPKYCEYVRQCGTHESCFVDSYVTANGHVRYNSGCRESSRCWSTSYRPAPITGRRSDPVVCSTCCQKSLCNNEGCGKTGWPLDRGPLCYNCDQQSNPSDCNKVRQCQRSQICSLMTKEIAGDMLYHSSCEYMDVCNAAKTHLLAAITTGADGCVKCCNSTLCNDNCDLLEPPLENCRDLTPDCSSYHISECQTNLHVQQKCHGLCRTCGR